MTAFNAEATGFLMPDDQEWFGQSVTLEADDRDDLTVTGVLGGADGDEVDDETGTYNARRRSLECKAADVTEPRAWKHVVIGTERWAIVEVSDENDVSVVFTLAIEAPTELAEPGYRE